MKPILEVKNISKLYRISGENVPYLSLRDSISKVFKSTNPKQNFYALNDVSFDVMQGDTIGIIGKNGAGKSTLLKILSKITPPTSGKIICRGRIASLLEVGTGFHPELSGRENIFMNGSILGMRKEEINRNFDAIVDFSGIEKFIDTPLKHYSSGMQLRLAFAVAAFLENEILIIDEVLAVGDAEFQSKCLGKMKEVTGQGRTVLFVSHDLGAVSGLCTKGLLIEDGTIKQEGLMEKVINTYISSSAKSEVYYNKTQSSEIHIEEARFLTNNDSKGNIFKMDEDISVSLKLRNCSIPNHLSLGITLYDQRNYAISTTHIEINEKSGYEVVGKIKKGNLMPGFYSIHGVLHVPFQRYYDKMSEQLEFEVVDSGEFTKKYGREAKGPINSIIEW